MRVVVDTNVWVSALLSRGGPPCRLPGLLRAGRFLPVVSERLLSELATVASRPRFVSGKHAFARAAAVDLLDVLRRRAVIVELAGALALCRDPDDDAVLETAILGRAEVLVTGDRDLLDDEEARLTLAAGGIALLTAREFVELLERFESA